MLRYAYQLGVKLAMLDEGIPVENNNPNSPADQLAAILQKIPGPDPEPRPAHKGIGDPAQDTRYGDRSVNYAFDDLSHLGLDIQGPTSTAV